MKKVDELSQLKMLREGMIRIEEEQSGPVVYKDIGGYAGIGEYIAFESERDFRIYVSGLDYEANGEVGGGDNIYYFKLVSGIPAKMVVPGRIITRLNTAMELGHLDIVEDLTDDVNEYFFRLANENTI